jgi:hypothetical protein
LSDQQIQHPIEPGDDRIIAVAFRRSLGLLAAIAVLVCSGVLLMRQGSTAEEVRSKKISAPEILEESVADRPPVNLTEITNSSGVDFVHFNGATGDKLLPETMGSGVAFFDADSDGDQDLLLVNGDSWPWDRSTGARPTMALYANDGTGRFTNITRTTGLDVPLYGMGVAVGDLDNDGDADLYLTAVGRNRLFRNDRSRFTEITGAAGVGGDDDDWSTGAAFFDFDNDGDLDLMVVNYVRWSREIDFEVGFTLNGTDRAYGPPTAFAGTYPVLYRNEGNGRFTDISASAGIRIDNPATGEPIGKSLGLTLVDLDDDRDIDVLVANDTVQNFLFEKLGNDAFAEVGAAAGVAFDGAGRATGAMGVDAADLRGEGSIGFAIGNFANEMTSFYAQQHEPWLFADEAVVEGIGSPSRLKLSFGVLFLDYDLDGWLDLLQVNGHLEEAISEVQASQSYRQAAQLFWNAGPEASSCFTAVPADELGDLGRPIVGRAAASADIDGDGDLDLILTENGGPPLLLRNDQQTGNHWLRITLEGTLSNRDAIGAWVEVEVAGRSMRRQLMPTRGYLSQVERVLTFGLGSATTVDAARVHWPSGVEQEIVVAAVDQTIAVREPSAPLLGG